MEIRAREIFKILVQEKLCTSIGWNHMAGRDEYFLSPTWVPDGSVHGPYKTRLNAIRKLRKLEEHSNLRGFTLLKKVETDWNEED